MSRTQIEDGVLFGRIGFEMAGASVDLWNDTTKDFQPVAQRDGKASSFAVRLADLRVAFQLRPNYIKATSFTGALQGILNESSPVHQWRVVPEIEGETFDEWAGQVERVTELSIVINRPNPNYRGREEIERLVENSNAEQLRILFQAKKEEVEGINIDDAFIQQAIAQAAETGGFKAKGEGAAPGRDRWSSDTEGAALERRVEADPTTGEVSSQRLSQELQSTGPPSSEDIEESP